jgi:hypothetical protein
VVVAVRLSQCLLVAIGQPHCWDNWFVSEDRSELYKVENNNSYQLNTLLPGHRQTRSGSRYRFSSLVPGQCDRSTRGLDLPT